MVLYDGVLGYLRPSLSVFSGGLYGGVFTVVCDLALLSSHAGRVSWNDAACCSTGLAGLEVSVSGLAFDNFIVNFEAAFPVEGGFFIDFFKKKVRSWRVLSCRLG